jgi:hypothetical protein
VKSQVEDYLLVFIEKNILKYGLNYIYDIISAIDALSQNKLDSITEAITVKSKEAEQIKVEIQNLKTECITKKGKQFVNLVNKITELIRTEYEIEMMKKQSDLLNWFCIGERGWIDDIEKRLFELKIVLSNTADLSKREFEIELVRKFLDSKRDVTTFYLPEISTFVGIEGWKESNEFSKKYNDIIKSEVNTSTGISEPVRFSEKPAFKKDIESMLNSILTNSESTGLKNGYSALINDDISGTNYFNNYFKGKQIADNCLESLQKIINKYYTEVISKDTDGVIYAFKNTSLKYIYNSLGESLKDNISKGFDDNKIHVFFYPDFTPGSKHDTVLLYAGNDKKFAQNFGYDEKNPKITFVEEDKSDSLYKFIYWKGVNIKEYGYYDILKSAYENNYKTMMGHLHKRFNEKGLDKIWEEWSEKSKPDSIRLFLKFLLYSKFFEKIESEKLSDTFFNDNIKKIANPSHHPVQLNIDGENISLIKCFNSYFSEDGKVGIDKRNIEEILNTDVSISYFINNPDYESIRNKLANNESQLNKIIDYFKLSINGSGLKDKMTGLYNDIVNDILNIIKTLISKTPEKEKADFYYAMFDNMTEKCENLFKNELIGT